MRHLFQRFLLLLCVGVAGIGSVGAMTVSRNGEPLVEKIAFTFRIYDGSWKSFLQGGTGFRVRTRQQVPQGKIEDFQLRASLEFPGLPAGEFTSSFRENSENVYTYRGEVKFSAPADLRFLGLVALLPVDEFCGRELRVDGKPLELPREWKEGAPSSLFDREVSELVIPTLDRTLSIRGKFRLTVQDERAYKLSRYMVRIGFSPCAGKITEASQQLTFTEEPYRSTPIDLRSAVNMGFSDETAGDQQGGWTDQGAENDLRMIPVGRQRWVGVNFDIIDPARNNGKSCLMLAGPSRSYFPRQAAVRVEPAVRGNYLFLLHGLAWPSSLREIGRVRVVYQDGTATEIPVTGNVDVGNWWAPVTRRNGELAWTGTNASSFVGLYRSTFPIENKPIREISFTSSGRSVWGIVAASVGDQRIPRLASAPVYIIAGRDWQPVGDGKDVLPGSALDFSSRLDAPAGKYGPVVIRNGKLTFRDRPDQPVRFYGTNLCSSSQYLSKEWAEKLADRMAAFGFNAVRLHHHDGGLSMRTKESSTGLNPEKLDQLDYLISCFKKRGIYVTTDLYVSRPFAKGEIPEFPDKWLARPSFKALPYLLDSALQNWMAFSRNWLTHVNPYTGVALKDEPALISLSLINEGNLNSTWKGEAFVADFFEQEFRKWREKNAAKFPAGTTEDVMFSQFLVECNDNGFQKMKKFVRELGVQCPISDQNMRSQPLLSVMRDQYDYVDNHGYWEHPTFPNTAWKLPSAHQNQSVLAREAELPASLMSSRIFNKPMMITEFDYAAPNVNRAEGAVVMGSYAALQDWDALFQFAYAHNNFNVTDASRGPSGHFDLSTDVVKALSQKIGLALFLDGGLEPLPELFAIALTGGEGLDFTRGYSSQVPRLGLVARIGTVILPEGKIDPARMPENLTALLNPGFNFPSETGNIPVFDASEGNLTLLQDLQAKGLLPKQSFDAKQRIFRANGGRVELNAGEQTFRAVTPRCEALILPAGKSGKGSFLEVSNQVGRAVFSAISLDRRPLAESGRTLLLHLTDTQASKTKYHSAAMTQLDAWGTPPYLAARGEAEIVLHVAPGGAYRLYALDVSGKRLGETAFRREGDVIRFPARVFTDAGAVLAYELVRE